MKLNTTQLLDELSRNTRTLINEAETLLLLPDDLLQKRPGNGGWNALECIEHLNLYGEFYLPEIRKSIRESRQGNAPFYQPGWLGNYFVKTLEPGKQMKKMKTFKDKDPIERRLDKETIERFIDQQNEMLELLHKAKGVDLGKTKTHISISKWLKLKLGDTFRFVVTHNRRHMAQAFACLPTTQKAKSIV
ncbi:MAG TPA: DinB family protein [Phnomibacter sp.]|nr:DinB family protein [Phnomibacter sp.]